MVVTRTTKSEGDEEMTRTISFIIGIAVVALVAVPTALGEGRLAGSEPQSGVAYFKANELATLVQQPVRLRTNGDGNRGGRVSSRIADLLVAKNGTTDALKSFGGFTPGSLTNYKDANERVVAPVDHGIGRYVDANQRGTVPSSPDVEPEIGRASCRERM